MPRVKEFRARLGGIMRCCIKSLDERGEQEVPENRLLPCDYHSSDTPVWRLAEDDVWEWVGPDDAA